MTAYGYLIYFLCRDALILLMIVGLIGIIIAGAILPFYLWRKRNKRIGALFAFVIWVTFLVILNRIACPTYWKYPDFIIHHMELVGISKVWGKYDVIAPAREGDEEYFQVVGYKIGKDDDGIDQYYFIYEHGYQTGDWEYDIWIGKGEKFIENWYEYYTENANPKYYELQTYIDKYVEKGGNVYYLPGLHTDEDQMLAYLGVSRDEFLKMVYEQYPDFNSR